MTRIYIQNFLFAFLVSSVIAELGFFFQMYRLSFIWAEHFDGSDMGFLLRIAVYLLALTFYLAAVAQLVCVLLSKIHLALSVFVSTPAVIALAQPVLLIAKLVTGNTMQEKFGVLTYLGWDIPQGILEKDYVPVITDVSAVKTWGITLQIGLVLMGVLCLVLGLLYFEKVATKQKEEKRSIKVQPLPQQGELFVACGDTEGTEEEDFSLMKPFSYEKLDIWENIQTIQLACGKEDIKKARKIAELTGLDGIGTRKRAIKTYSDGMYRCYILAIELMEEPEILVGRGILEDLGEADVKEVRETLMRIKEAKIPTLLFCKDTSAVEDIVDKVL